MNKLFAMGLCLVSMSAFANYKLSKSKKTITCHGEDNVSVVLSSAKTTVKFIQEGESIGPRRIRKFTTDKQSFSSYETDEVTLTLSDKGDTYKVNTDEDAYEVNCKN